MSGGSLSNTYSLETIAEEIQLEIDNNYTKDEYGDCNNYSPLTLAIMSQTVDKLMELQKDIRKIDYLLSGDINEEDTKKYFREKGLEELD